MTLQGNISQEHKAYSTEQARWDAIRHRDRMADGSFFYAVITTGVYCRPSCGARPPRSENVRFYLTGADAARAGFRPCKRCRPDEPALEQRQGMLVAQACRLIENGVSPPKLDELASALSVSPYHLHRVFKTVTGVTPKAYAAARRSQRLNDTIAQSKSVTEACYEAGFSSSGRFYEEAKERLGMTPSQRRAGGKGARIRFAIAATALGSVLVAATDRGICAIEMGDDPQVLAEGLQDRFPQAELIGGDAAFETLVSNVLGLITTPRKPVDLPLDIRGTAFQQLVWQALREIPCGATADYSEIARRIGRPEAVRAVARACASNEIALAIPCHRVVRKDGSLSGYRWGVMRKKRLLEIEGAR